MLLAILNIFFFLFIGLEYLGVSFQYQNLLIGIAGVVIGAVMLVNLIQSSRA